MNLYEKYIQSDEVIVSRNEEFGLASVKYKNLGADWLDKDILNARGLVIDFNGNIIARPYEKFFNYQQFGDSTDINKDLYELTSWHSDFDYLMDKADGSLVIAYTHNDRLFLSSSGVVDGTYSKLFFELLAKYNPKTKELLKELGKTYTLMFEYVGPNNQIVLNYKNTEFRLHGARNTSTGEYLPYSALEKIAQDLEINIVEKFPEIDSLNKVLDALPQLVEKEGFVAVFKDGFRLKFKTEDYLKLHRQVSGLRTKANTAQNVEFFKNDTLDDHMAFMLNESKGESHELQVEFFNALLEQISVYNKKYAKIKEYIEKLYKKTKVRKEQALDIIKTSKDKDEDNDIYFFFLQRITQGVNIHDISLGDILKESLSIDKKFKNEFWEVINDKNGGD